MDSNNRILSSLLQIASSTAKSLVDFLQNVYILLLGLKSLVNVVVYIFYLNLRRKLKTDNINNDRRRTLSIKLEWIKKFMNYAGFIYQGSEATGIFINSVTFSAVFAFHIIERYYLKQLKAKYFTRGFIMFLKNSEFEANRINDKISSIVKQLIESNINYTRCVVLRYRKYALIKQPTKYDDLFLFEKDSYQTKGSQFISKPWNQLTLESSLGGRQTKTTNWKKYKHSIQGIDLSRNKTNAIINLQNQLHYLISLLNQDKRRNNLWPVNRNSHWRSKVMSIYLTYYLVNAVSFWVLGEIFLNILHEVFRLSHKNRGNFDRIVHQLSILDDHMMLLLILDWTVSSLGYLLLLVLDQLKYLNSLVVKFNDLKNLNNALIETCEQANCASSRESKSNLPLLFDCNSSSMLNSNHRLSIINSNIESDCQKKNLSKNSLDKEGLRFKCDCLALEIYICFKYFTDETRFSLGLNRFLMDQRAVVVVIVLLSTSAFINLIPIENQSAVLMCVCLILLGVNFAFSVCAWLDSVCTRTTKQVWSLLANSAIVASKSNTQQHRLTMQDLHGLSFPGTDKLEYNYYGNIYMTDEIGDGALTPHTIVLWQQWIANFDLLCENFRAQIFGSIKINFNGILKINFWVVSFILVTLTYLDEAT